MPKRIHKVVLDSNKSTPLFEINKLDSLHLEVEVTEVETLENAEVELFFKKSDGTLVSEIISEKEQNILKIDVKNGALDVPGIVVGQAKITEEDGNISSHMFKFNIKNSITSDDAIVNEIGIGAIEELKEKINNAQIDPEVLKNKIEETINNGDLDVVSKEELQEINSQLDKNKNDIQGIKDGTIPVQATVDDTQLSNKVNDAVSKLDLASISLGDGSVLENNISDGAVSIEKTSFVKKNKNLVDITKCKYGYYINWSTGEEVSNVQYYVSDFIPVKPGQKLASNKHNSLVFFDSSKTFVAGINGSGTTGKNYTIVSGEIGGTDKEAIYTVPNNCYFVRLTIDKKNINIIQLELGETSTDYEEYGITINDLILPNKKISKVKKVGDVITIQLTKSNYIFKKVVDNSININTWRLYEGNITNNKGIILCNMWSNSDAEGAIQIKGEDDFISGFHGDEIIKSIVATIDGQVIDLSSDIQERDFITLKFIVESDVYHCNTSSVASNIAFKRVKVITFENDTVKIANRYTAQEDLTIFRGAIALFQCYKSYGGKKILLGYNDNENLNYVEIPETTGELPEGSNKIKEVNLYTNVGLINVKMNSLLNEEYYKGFINNFADQNRVKVYFDYIQGNSSGTPIKSGDVLQCEFEFSIK